MRSFHTSYPVYRWRRNKGYGTRHHIAAIRTYGTCRYHRGIFVTTALSVGKLK
jgi:ribonuclease HII